MSCAKGLVRSGALCYPPCANGTGVGPLCWGSCPKDTSECGALCLGEDQFCGEYVADEVKVAFQLAVEMAEHSRPDAYIDLAKIGVNLRFPTCPNW